MAPKTANTSAKRQTGTLNSWLKTPSHSNKPQKRPRPDSNTMDATPSAENKKQKTDPETRIEPLPSNGGTSHQLPKPSKPTNTITLNETTGDIFTAPPATLIIHACNCQGSWGGGIALAFKKHYPEAFKVYAKHCRDVKDGKALLGTALLIPPVDGRAQAPKIGGTSRAGKGGGKHFVGCLFTSNFYGKRRDPPSKILDATGPAMEDLLRQVRDWNAECENEGENVGEVRMCRINSGLFGVPWEDTVDVLEGIGVGGGEDGDEGKGVVIEVVEREE